MHVCSTKPWAVFRCDAGRRLGGGHVQRSMTLAHGLVAQGWRIGFAVSSETLEAVPALGRQGWRVEPGYDDPGEEAQKLVTQWPGGVDLAIIDHYSRDAVLERPLAAWARCRLVIDDLADRPHDCEILLDSTVARGPEDYRHLVGAQTEILAGPEYALVRDEFRAAAAERRARIAACGYGDVQSVVLAFGLTDLGGITDRVAGLLLSCDQQARFDAIIGSAAEGRVALLERAAKEPRLNVHILPPDVARLMASADLAVGAGGQTMFERCCLGLPTVALSIADNQLRSLDILSKLGALVHVSAFPRFDGAAVVAAYRSLMQDAAARARMAERAIAVCDGGGVARVIARLQNFAS